MSTTFDSGLKFIVIVQFVLGKLMLIKTFESLALLEANRGKLPFGSVPTGLSLLLKAFHIHFRDESYSAVLSCGTVIHALQCLSFDLKILKVA